MNAVVQVGTVISGEYMPHLKRGPQLQFNRLLQGKPSEAESSGFLRKARNMGFNVKAPQVLIICHCIKKIFF